ncbi:host specificity factor TipJ family phage tail protein [Enterobacter asburiae]|uniref:host specificity factor TipJ family phage tail protein n=1 Tax=Enterobacter asburiae TaxID=61645 RepID=UPI00192B8487|nr:host specificity factor TipJ family phage tail protein [Enterobacter asburiae]MBL5924946.1 hypothetical protein [Enterobacter asburiae]MBL5955733.1 hypothetical protein [Enterobacter asburiae]
MLIIWRDPRGVLGKDVHELNTSISLQQNIARHFPGGLDANTTAITLNGDKINPLEVDLSRCASHFDRVEIIIRQQGVELAIGAVIAVVAAIAVVAFMPKPTIPNGLGSQKDSPNNDLTGQTNTARLYQAIPDIYGKIRAFPDLVEPSLSEYIDNVKNITEVMCIGVGNYLIENVKYADTLLSTINGASYEVFNPGDVIPTIYDAAESPDVDGQEITPPNLGDSVLYTAETSNVVSLSYSGTVATIRIIKNDDFDYFYDKSKPINIRFTVNVKYKVANPNGTTSDEEGQFQLSGILVGMGISDDGAVVNPVQYYDMSVNGISPGNDYPIDGVVQSTYLKVEDMEALYVGPFIMASESDQIWYNIIFQRGLNGHADLTAEWWQVDANNDEIPGTNQSESFTYSADTYEGQYFTRKIAPAAGRGRYAFRIVRTNNGSDQLTDQAKLEEVYSVQVRNNVVAGDTLIRCVTTATEQATGLKDRKFNAEVTRKTITWNGSSVVNTLNPSRDFADAILHSFVVIAGRDAGELDLDELYAISASIKANNERLGWFDFSFDDMDISLGQRLQSICNAARVKVFRDGLKWRFVREEKKGLVSAQFDARNLANDDTGGTLQYKGHLPTSYDGVELEWVDATDTNDDGTDKKAYIRLRVDAASKQILEEGAVRPYKIQLAGCRNKDQAMNRAQLEARRLIYQRMSVEDVALSDANMVQIGDRVRWADVYDEAVASGEILQISGNTFTTSEKLIFDSGMGYKVSITDQFGYPSQWITVSPVAGDDSAFQANFTGAYTADNITAMLGSRFILTPSVASDPMDFVLAEKAPGEDSSQIKISLSQYDERMFAYD